MGVIENMSGFVCPHCGEPIDLFKKGGGQKAAEELNVPFLGAVPIDPQIVQDTDAGKPFVNQDNGAEANKAFKKIMEQVLKNY